MEIKKSLDQVRAVGLLGRRKKISKQAKFAVMLIPFVLLWVDGVSIFMYSTKYYGIAYPYLTQIFGHSLLPCFVMAFYAHIHRSCSYTKISIIGLVSLNVVNMIPGEYWHIYATVTAIIFLSLTTLAFFRPKIEMGVKEIIKTAVYPVFVYLNLDIETVLILTVLMVIDSLAGAVKTIRIGGQFKMKVLVWGFVIKIFFLLIPVTLALMGKGIGKDFIFIVDVFLQVMIISEVYSIWGNIWSIKNKKEAKKFDAISAAIKAFRSILYTGLKKGIKSIEKSANCELIEKDNR